MSGSENSNSPRYCPTPHQMPVPTASPPPSIQLHQSMSTHSHPHHLQSQQQASMGYYSYHNSSAPPPPPQQQQQQNYYAAQQSTNSGYYGMSHTHPSQGNTGVPLLPQYSQQQQQQQSSPQWSQHVQHQSAAGYYSSYTPQQQPQQNPYVQTQHQQSIVIPPQQQQQQQPQYGQTDMGLNHNLVGPNRSLGLSQHQQQQQHVPPLDTAGQHALMNLSRFVSQNQQQQHPSQQQNPMNNVVVSPSTIPHQNLNNNTSSSGTVNMNDNNNTGSSNNNIIMPIRPEPIRSPAVLHHPLSLPTPPPLSTPILSATTTITNNDNIPRQVLSTPPLSNNTTITNPTTTTSTPTANNNNNTASISVPPASSSPVVVAMGSSTPPVASSSNSSSTSSSPNANTSKVNGGLCPVRVANQKGARTKAGMRNLLEHQKLEQQTPPSMTISDLLDTVEHLSETPEEPPKKRARRKPAAKNVAESDSTTTQPLASTSSSTDDTNIDSGVNGAQGSSKTPKKPRKPRAPKTNTAATPPPPASKTTKRSNKKKNELVNAQKETVSSTFITNTVTTTTEVTTSLTSPSITKTTTTPLSSPTTTTTKKSSRRTPSKSPGRATTNNNNNNVDVTTSTPPSTSTNITPRGKMRKSQSPAAQQTLSSSQVTKTEEPNESPKRKQRSRKTKNETPTSEPSKVEEEIAFALLDLKTGKSSPEKVVKDKESLLSSPSSSAPSTMTMTRGRETTPVASTSSTTTNVQEPLGSKKSRKRKAPTQPVKLDNPPPVITSPKGGRRRSNSKETTPVRSKAVGKKAGTAAKEKGTLSKRRSNPSPDITTSRNKNTGVENVTGTTKKRTYARKKSVVTTDNNNIDAATTSKTDTTSTTTTNKKATPSRKPSRKKKNVSTEGLSDNSTSGISESIPPPPTTTTTLLSSSQIISSNTKFGTPNTSTISTTFGSETIELDPNQEFPILSIPDDPTSNTMIIQAPVNIFGEPSSSSSSIPVTTSTMMTTNTSTTTTGIKDIPASKPKRVNNRKSNAKAKSPKKEGETTVKTKTPSRSRAKASPANKTTSAPKRRSNKKPTKQELKQEQVSVLLSEGSTLIPTLTVQVSLPSTTTTTTSGSEQRIGIVGNTNKNVDEIQDYPVLSIPENVGNTPVVVNTTATSVNKTIMPSGTVALHPVATTPLLTSIPTLASTNATPPKRKRYPKKPKQTVDTRSDLATTTNTSNNDNKAPTVKKPRPRKSKKAQQNEAATSLNAFSSSSTIPSTSGFTSDISSSTPTMNIQEPTSSQDYPVLCIPENGPKSVIYPSLTLPINDSATPMATTPNQTLMPTTAKPKKPRVSKKKEKTEGTTPISSAETSTTEIPNKKAPRRRQPKKKQETDQQQQGINVSQQAVSQDLHGVTGIKKSELSLSSGQVFDVPVPGGVASLSTPSDTTTNITATSIILHQSKSEISPKQQPRPRKSSPKKKNTSLQNDAQQQGPTLNNTNLVDFSSPVTVSTILSPASSPSKTNKRKKKNASDIKQENLNISGAPLSSTSSSPSINKKKSKSDNTITMTSPQSISSATIISPTATTTPVSRKKKNVKSNSNIPVSSPLLSPTTSASSVISPLASPPKKKRASNPKKRIEPPPTNDSNLLPSTTTTPPPKKKRKLTAKTETPIADVLNTNNLINSTTTISSESTPPKAKPVKKSRKSAQTAPGTPATPNITGGNLDTSAIATKVEDMELKPGLLNNTSSTGESTPLRKRITGDARAEIDRKENETIMNVSLDTDNPLPPLEFYHSLGPYSQRNNYPPSLPSAKRQQQKVERRKSEGTEDSVSSPTMINTTPTISTLTSSSSSTPKGERVSTTDLGKSASTTKFSSPLGETTESITKGKPSSPKKRNSTSTAAVAAAAKKRPAPISSRPRNSKNSRSSISSVGNVATTTIIPSSSPIFNSKMEPTLQFIPALAQPIKPPSVFVKSAPLADTTPSKHNGEVEKDVGKKSPQNKKNKKEENAAQNKSKGGRKRNSMNIGPSLKVKNGGVKFYRGSDEEDIDIPLNKLRVDRPSDTFDTNVRWVCSFCQLPPHVQRLGDLFGPYYVNMPSTRANSQCQRETWMHQDCAVWAGGVVVIGVSVKGLDRAVIDSNTVKCAVCNAKGATIGCLKRKCPQAAHFPCAQKSGWKLDDETFHSYCQEHSS